MRSNVFINSWYDADKSIKSHCMARGLRLWDMHCCYYLQCIWTVAATIAAICNILQGRDAFVLLFTMLSNAILRFRYYLQSFGTHVFAIIYNVFEHRIACLSLFTITINSSANFFALTKYSIWPLCKGLKYPETIIPVFLILTYSIIIIFYSNNVIFSKISSCLSFNEY